jgi:hypothetical protein
LIASKIKLGLPVQGIDKLDGNKNIDIIINADIKDFPPTDKKIDRSYGAKVTKSGIEIIWDLPVVMLSEKEPGNYEAFWHDIFRIKFNVKIGIVKG